MIESGLEDRLPVEVAARPMGNRHRVNDRELVAVPQRAERREPGCQAEQVVERRQFRLFECERTAKHGVVGVADGDDGSESVEPAAQQHEYKPAILRHLREADSRSRTCCEPAVTHVANELSAVHGHLH